MDAILMYHRIGAASADPWSLAVTPDHFAQHMEVLHREHSVVSLGRLADGRDRRPDLTTRVAVTFDDGYLDNLIVAKPILERLDVPATFFVTTGALGGRGEFWWDDLERIILHSDPWPEALALDLEGEPTEITLVAPVSVGSVDSASGEDVICHPDRLRLYSVLWQRLQALADAPRRRIMTQLRAWSGTPEVARPSHQVLRLEQLPELRAGRLVEIGAHTVTHPPLSKCSAAVQRSEIQQSAAVLEDVLDERPESFSYPYGDFTESVVHVVREEGFRRAVAAESARALSSADSFCLPRIHVKDWDGAEFAARLSRILRPERLSIAEPGR